MRILETLAATFVAGSLCASIASASEGPASYCDSSPVFAQFDFWIGHWDVYAGERLVGQNTISKDAGGCVIREHWVNMGGTHGYSLRHYNPLSSTWEMFWVSDAYTVKTEGRELEPGVVLLEGKIHYFQSEQISDFRVRFTAREDGTVRQLAEQRDTAEEGWKTWFDGRYRRAGENADTKERQTSD
ncbi:MAG: hypothetical protein AAFX56_14085 [Pseudomonadota bacterium]